MMCLLVVADGDDFRPRGRLDAVFRRTPHDEHQRRLHDVAGNTLRLRSGATRWSCRKSATSCLPACRLRIRGAARAAGRSPDQSPTEITPAAAIARSPTGSPRERVPSGRRPKNTTASWVFDRFRIGQQGGQHRGRRQPAPSRAPAWKCRVRYHLRCGNAHSSRVNNPWPRSSADARSPAPFAPQRMQMGAARAGQAGSARVLLADTLGLAFPIFASRSPTAATSAASYCMPKGDVWPRLPVSAARGQLLSFEEIVRRDSRCSSIRVSQGPPHRWRTVAAPRPGAAGRRCWRACGDLGPRR